MPSHSTNKHSTNLIAYLSHVSLNHCIRQDTWMTSWITSEEALKYCFFVLFSCTKLG